MAGKGTYSDRLPPYASYTTWQKLLEGLKRFLPDEIDRSFYDSLGFSGSQILTLKSALRFLSLVDQDNVPTEKLRQLVQSDGHKQKDILREIIQQAYVSLFNTFNLQTITQGQLSRYFESLGAKGDIQRKCTSFFLAIASEAGIELSLHLSGRSKLGIGRKSIATKAKEKKRLETKMARGTELPSNSSWMELVLKKFPDLDPTWPDETKKKWFEDFKELLRVNH